MATWPSASKAPTTNLDSGTDSPAAARADIKTNVDNVNEIIDMFNIASPTNNQILQYSTANSRFEVATPSSGGNPTVIVEWGDAVEIAGGAQRQVPTELSDPAGIFSISSTYNFTLPAGTYIMSLNSKLVTKQSNWSAGDTQWVSVSGDSGFSPFTVTGTGLLHITFAGEKFTLTQTSTFYMQPPASTAFYNASSVPKIVVIEKIA